MSTSKFEDHLWREFVREHGDDLAQLNRPATGHPLRRPRLVGAAGFGLAGGATALALVLSATSAPAFAVTRNQNGTVTVTIRSASGIAGANAKLNQLGVRARVMAKAPAGCEPTQATAHSGGVAVQRFTPLPGMGTATGQWTINPTAVATNQSLVLTPPPAGNSGTGNSGSGNSGTGNSGSGSGGQDWTNACSVSSPAGAVAGNAPPSPPPSAHSGTGNSGTGA